MLDLNSLPPLTARDEATIAFARIMDMTDDPALLQAIAAYGAAKAAAERERCAKEIEWLPASNDPRDCAAVLRGVWH